MRSCSRPVGIDPGHFGDRRRLAQQLQVFDAALLERVAGGVGARQRRPAELVLDVEDVLLDPRRRALRLLGLQRDQVRLVLAPGEVEADRAARDQHAADQRDDQQRVLGEEAPAARHAMRWMPMRRGGNPARARGAHADAASKAVRRNNTRRSITPVSSSARGPAPHDCDARPGRVSSIIHRPAQRIRTVRDAGRRAKCLTSAPDWAVPAP